VRGLAHRHEQNEVELELPEGFLNADQVPDVRRVEGTPENTYAQRSKLLWRGVCATRAPGRSRGRCT
jgi:hypothetical protein